MEMPADRRRWFVAASPIPRWLWHASPTNGSRQEGALARRGMLLPGFYVTGLGGHCPATLLRSLRPGDELEVTPDLGADSSRLRLEYGIFHVGYVPRGGAHLLAKLLERGFEVAARIGRIDLTAPLEQAVWVDACLLA